MDQIGSDIRNFVSANRSCCASAGEYVTRFSNSFYS